jgi:hypothetical protein
MDRVRHGTVGALITPRECKNRANSSIRVKSSRLILKLTNCCLLPLLAGPEHSSIPIFYDIYRVQLLNVRISEST